MAEPGIDYPEDPEKLSIDERLSVVGVHSKANFYPPSRPELTEALALLHDFSHAGVWNHLEFEVRQHQVNARNRTKRPGAAIAALVGQYKDSGEEAFAAAEVLGGLKSRIAGAFADSLNPRLTLADVADEQSRQGLTLVTRFRDMKLFAAKGPELGFNPLDIDYLSSEAEDHVKARVVETFAHEGLPGALELTEEAYEDQVARGIFHTDALKMCRRFRDRRAAGMAGEAVVRFRNISPVYIDLDEVQKL